MTYIERIGRRAIVLDHVELVEVTFLTDLDHDFNAR